MAETKIEWTGTIRPDGTIAPGFSFNPWVGCTKVSPACDFCYAESWAKRTGAPELWKGERRRTQPKNWGLPIKWNTKAKEDGIRYKVFCASLADVFDNQVPEEWRHDLWHLIDSTPHLDWLLLTKRPQNIEKMLPSVWGHGWPNVWLGTTVENIKVANQNIPALIGNPATVHFLNCEPLLEDLNLFGIVSYLDWVIAGGESGQAPRHTPGNWFRNLRDQCAGANVPFFMKQMTGKREIPDDLMVRQFPR